jgi:hypothetical protein
MYLRIFSDFMMPLQNGNEWQMFIEFAAAYFAHRDITDPVVVEIGTWDNRQKRFYEAAMHARHFGVDLKTDGIFKPDILGDSHNPLTLQDYFDLSGHAPIDLLFIDGDHTYEGIKADYELWGPNAPRLIAFHDVDNKKEPGAMQFWEYLRREYEDKSDATFIKFSCWSDPWKMTIPNLGIGVMVKQI